MVTATEGETWVGFCGPALNAAPSAAFLFTLPVADTALISATEVSR